MGICLKGKEFNMPSVLKNEKGTLFPIKELDSFNQFNQYFLISKTKSNMADGHRVYMLQNVRDNNSDNFYPRGDVVALVELFDNDVFLLEKTPDLLQTLAKDYEIIVIDSEEWADGHSGMRSDLRIKLQTDVLEKLINLMNTKMK